MSIVGLDGRKLQTPRAAPKQKVDINSIIPKLEQVLGLGPHTRFPADEHGRVMMTGSPGDILWLALACATALDKTGVLDAAIAARHLEAQAEAEPPPEERETTGTFRLDPKTPGTPA